MKKLIAITIALIVILAGCSSENIPLSSNQQSQSQQESTSQPSKGTSSNTDSIQLNNIDTAVSPFEKGYYDYQGIISNDMSIQLSIYPLGNDIVGSYFYDSQRTEIKLRGKAGDKDIVLYEYDETGKNTGVFKGEINTVDKISGTWISSDNKISYPFTLSLRSILPGAEYGKRYAVAVGAVSDQAVENFAEKIQGYVVLGDKKQLAEQVRYPIKVKINDKAIEILNADDFIMNYDQIIHADYKQAISNSSTRYLFANYQGIMFGAGSYNIWINEAASAGDTSKLMITAINN